MKVQDFAYHVAARTLELLSESHHYKIPEELRKEILARVQQEIDQILKASS